MRGPDSGCCIHLYPIINKKYCCHALYICMFKYLSVLCCGWYSRAACIGRCSIILHKPQSFCSLNRFAATELFSSNLRLQYFLYLFLIWIVVIIDLRIVLLCDDSFRSFFFNLHHWICWMMFGWTHWFDTFSELTTLLSFSFSTKFHHVFAWRTLATVFATTR